MAAVDDGEAIKTKDDGRDDGGGRCGGRDCRQHQYPAGLSLNLSMCRLINP